MTSPLPIHPQPIPADWTPERIEQERAAVEQRINDAVARAWAPYLVRKTAERLAAQAATNDEAA